MNTSNVVMNRMATKEVRINIRTTPQIKRDLEIAARLIGLTPSALVNSAVVRVIREEKERDPSAFAQRREPDLQRGAAISSAAPDTGIPSRLQDEIHTEAKRKTRK